MCTVTIVPLTDDRVRRRGLRLACNRDESRLRPPAAPPVIRRIGDRGAILPVDPVSDGTWIGVNDAGLAATLLNVNPLTPQSAVEESKPPQGRDSRGSIVPAVLMCASVKEAVVVAGQLVPGRYSPFRLVVLDDRTVAEIRSDGVTLLVVTKSSADLPLFFTSSGLGDELVDGPRRALFAGMFTAATDFVGAQEEFHRHRWPDRPHLSVSMSRPDAHTVSHTVVDLEPSCVRLSYLPHAPSAAGVRIERSLPRRIRSSCPS